MSYLEIAGLGELLVHTVLSQWVWHSLFCLHCSDGFHILPATCSVASQFPLQRSLAFLTAGLSSGRCRLVPSSVYLYQENEGKDLKVPKKFLKSWIQISRLVPKGERALCCTHVMQQLVQYQPHFKTAAVHLMLIRSVPGDSMLNWLLQLQGQHTAMQVLGTI